MQTLSLFSFAKGNLWTNFGKRHYRKFLRNQFRLSLGAVQDLVEDHQGGPHATVHP